MLLLLSHSADVHAKDRYCLTPLHLASDMGHLDIVKILILHGARTDSRMLFRSVLGRHVEVACLLLANGAAVNDVLREGTALHAAAKNGDTDCIRLLLEWKADVEGLKAGGVTPLHLTAYYGHVGVAELLLAADADPNLPTDPSVALLHISSSKRPTGIQTIFMEETVRAPIGAYHMREVRNLTPLHLASLKGHTETVQLLLIAGASVSAVLEGDHTALHLAVEAAASETVRLLIQNGADVTLRNNHDTTLHLAVYGNDREILTLILEMFSRVSDGTREFVDQRDADGDTPLMWAAELGLIEAAEVLLTWGADVNLKNYHQQTALEIALCNDNLDMIELFTAVGDSLDSVD